MRYGIVEGEPGIFPEPVARFLRAVGNLFNRGDKPSEAPGGEGEGTGERKPDADPPA